MGMPLTDQTLSPPGSDHTKGPGLPGPAGAFALAGMAGGAGVVALCAALPNVGLMAAGVALAAYCLAAMMAGVAMARDYPHDRLGLCNLVTLIRLVLVGTLVAPLWMGGGPSWPVLALATLTFGLDGLDGWLARRQGLTSAFGARFDMEVDAALALVLALNAAVGAGMSPILAGTVVVALGLPRYAFMAAGLALPWMRRDLPPRFSRKAVCVLQLAVLITLQVPGLPSYLVAVMVPAAAAALAWSFVRDGVWLWKARA
jgi:phosphatidylglycerophosphate synthase